VPNDKAMNSTVTIVVPTYNRADKLRRAVKSILAQTHTDVLVHVFDNASSDHTHDVVSELMQLDRRVIYHRHPTNIGMIGNFNSAFRSVSSPFFGILTDDDYYFPNFLEDALSGFAQFPIAKVSIVSIKTVDEHGTEISDHLDRWPKEGLYLPRDLVDLVTTGAHPCITGCIARKEVVSEFIFDERAESASDVPVLLRLTLEHPVCVSKSKGGHWVRHASADGSMFRANPRRMIPAFRRVLELLEEAPISDLRLKEHALLKLRSELRRAFSKVMLERLEHRDRNTVLFISQMFPEGMDRYEIVRVCVRAGCRILGVNLTAQAVQYARALKWALLRNSNREQRITN
jgi:hypothetical protein